MVAIVRTEWDGTSGGPGLTQFAVMGGTEFTSGIAQASVNAVRTFWDSLKVYLPNELKLTVLSTVDIYNDATGELTGSYAAPVPPTTVLGTSAATYAGGAGLKINWNTGTIRNGRRVRGSTFIVPAATVVFSATGTIDPSAGGAVSTAATTLIANLSSGGAPLLVWSRPLVKDGSITRAGASAGVINGICGPKSAILRGRRD